MTKCKIDTFEKSIDEFLDLVARLLARKHLHQNHLRDTEDPQKDRSAKSDKTKVRETRGQRSNA